MYVGVFFFLQAPAYEAIAARASSPGPWPGTALVYINTASLFQQRQLFSTYFATHEVQEWDASVVKYHIDDSGVACSSDYVCFSKVHRNVCPKNDIPSPPSPVIGLPMHMRRQWSFPGEFYWIFLFSTLEFWCFYVWIWSGVETLHRIETVRILLWTLIWSLIWSGHFCGQ